MIYIHLEKFIVSSNNRAGIKSALREVRISKSVVLKDIFEVCGEKEELYS